MPTMGSARWRGWRTLSGLACPALVCASASIKLVAEGAHSSGGIVGWRNKNKSAFKYSRLLPALCPPPARPPQQQLSRSWARLFRVFSLH